MNTYVHKYTYTLVTKYLWLGHIYIHRCTHTNIHESLSITLKISPKSADGNHQRKTILGNSVYTCTQRQSRLLTHSYANY